MERKAPLALPVQTTNDNDKKSNDSYKLSEFIGKDDEYLSRNTEAYMLVDNLELLKNNLDFFKHIISLSPKRCIYSESYDALKILENEMQGKELYLIDDYKSKDRSYINTSYFEKNKFTLPLSYAMWNPKFENIINVSCIRRNCDSTMYSGNGDKKITKDTILKFKEIISNLKDIGTTDLEKSIVVSNYLQSKVQYVDDSYETHANGKIYVIDCSPDKITGEKVGSIESVIFQNYGLCMAIANTTTLLLDNPEINVNARSIRGNLHVWNLVTIDGKKYHIDNTWSITKNNNCLPYALKTTAFSDDYLLLGSDKIDTIPYHDIFTYIDGIVEKEDFDRQQIEEARKSLSKKISFSYDSKTTFESRIK